MTITSNENPLVNVLCYSYEIDGAVSALEDSAKRPDDYALFVQRVETAVGKLQKELEPLIPTEDQYDH